MAIKARETITIIKERDVNAIWRFYRIASSSSTPSQPTEAQGKAYVNNQTVPSGWSISEPAYDGTSTNSLYTCDLTSFTDGEVSWSTVSKSSSYEAAKQAYNEAQNAKKTATNYLSDLSNGVYVHASGTTADPTNANAKGVKITDVVDIIRAGQSVGQFGENIRLGKQDSIHFQIADSVFGYYVDDVPVSTLGCSYDLDEDDEVGSKNMELKVVSPVFSNTDKAKASLILHYDHGSGSAHPTYARLFVQNLDSQLGNMAYVEVTESQADSDVLLYSEGTTFRLHGHDGFGALKGNLLVEGNAGMIQMFAGSTAPKGWLMCQGQAVSRTTYDKLFSVIGTTYGEGDGSTTFNLPDFRDRFPVGAGTTYARNSKGGAASVTLTTNTIPAHTHGKSGAISGGITSSGAHTHTFKTQADYAAKGTKKGIYSDSDGTWTGTSVMTSTGAHTHNLPAHEHTSVGGGAAHENRPPYIGINFIICTGRLWY